jgi:hypothetical protein
MQYEFGHNPSPHPSDLNLPQHQLALSESLGGHAADNPNCVGDAAAREHIDPNEEHYRG